MPISRGDFIINVYDGATLLETIDVLDLSERSFRLLVMRLFLDNNGTAATSPHTYNIQAGKITPIKGRRLIDADDGGET